jgi:hypothetical protein
MSTDTGIDLVAYSPHLRGPLTIQVKTNLQAKPGGGRGKLALDWWVPEASPADYVALVDLSTEKTWLLSQQELISVAQQRSNSRLHVYMYIDPSARPRKMDRIAHAYEFERFILSNRAHEVFGLHLQPISIGRNAK